MLKNILNLKGAQKLSIAEQTTINGGGSSRCATNPCAGQPNGTCCTNNFGVKLNCEKGCCRAPRTPDCTSEIGLGG